MHTREKDEDSVITKLQEMFWSAFEWYKFYLLIFF